MSVGDRLARLLFIVPYVAHRDGVPIQELADLLDVKPAQVEADLALLCMVGRPPLTPDHLIDLMIEDDIVYVELDQSLSRPLRLTQDEARALVLAARMVGQSAGSHARLDALLERITCSLNPVDAELVRSLSQRISMVQSGQANFDPAESLHHAICEDLEVEVDYYSVSSDQQKRYRLQPIALLNHTGTGYLVALDVVANLQEKLFRLDRMGSVEVTEELFDRPWDIDLEKYRTRNLVPGHHDSLAEVRFAPEIAREVQERFADKRTEVHSDGSVTVRLSTSSPGWLARWVLPFAEKAEIVGPIEQRAWIGDLCRQAVEAYSKEPSHLAAIDS